MVKGDTRSFHFVGSRLELHPQHPALARRRCARRGTAGTGEKARASDGLGFKVWGLGLGV